MANIIDRFVVEFGLDPKAFTKGQKEVVDGIKKIHNANTSSSKDIEQRNNRSAASFSKVRNEVVGLALAFTGAKSITGFLKDLVTGDAAIGRFSSSIGTNAQGLKAWQKQLESMSGSAQEATSVFAALADARDDIARGGTGGAAAIPLRNLGVTVEELMQGPEAVLKALAERRTALSKNDNQFAGQLRMLGASPAMVEELKKGRAEVDRDIEAQKKLNGLTDEQIRKSQDLTTKITNLGTALQGAARGPLGEFIDGLMAADKEFGLFNSAVPAAVGVIGAMATAAIIANPELVILAASIGAIATAIQKLNDADVHSGQGFWGTIKRGVFNIKQGWYDMRASTMRKAADAATDPKEKAFLESEYRRYTNLASQNREDERTSASPSPARPGPAAGGGGGSTRIDPEIYKALAAKYGPERAAGIAAGIAAESGNNPYALNRQSGAYGLGQWLGPRKRGLIQRYGLNPSKAQQLEYLMWELDGGDHGGKKVLGQRDRRSALQSYIVDFMRPASGNETTGDLQRGMAALGNPGARSAVRMARAAPPAAVAGSGSTTVNIAAINLPNAKDAEGVARDLPVALARRGLTVQANRGIF